MEEQRMSIADAKKHLEGLKAALAEMGGVDRSGYLPFEIERFETAISEFEKREKK